MVENEFDIIVIGCGSAGLSVGLFMNEAKFKVLMVSTNDHSIGGDCLNDGCVPSKAFIHIAKMAHVAKQANDFGLEVSGNVDIKKATDYIHSKQEIIREHENASWLKNQGVNVALGATIFTSKNEIKVNNEIYKAKKIVIATGSKPKKLKTSGVEQIKYYDNENIFNLDKLPEKLLVVGGGPIGIEMAQTLSRLGSKVTIIHQEDAILGHDDKIISQVLLEQLTNEGIKILLNTKLESFTSPHEALVKLKEGNSINIEFDAVYVGVGREPNFESLQLENADVKVNEGKIIINKFLQTTNKNIFVCGDVAGDLQFSHAAEFHARILLNNFFSLIKQKLNNDHMSWVTFSDPEVATFGLSEQQLQKRKMNYERLELGFEDDDRAVVNNYRYGKMVLFIEKKVFLKKQKIVGGSMVAPNAGELIQELILANTNGISIDAIFNKIYPYPVASRVNQKIILDYKQKNLTDSVKKVLKVAYKIFS